ncbi:MAG: hypothetical protein ACTSRG_20640 [Candidatus Helarchaeota archaeon]
MIFHVIGLHCVGKSTFIKEKFPDAILLDMKRFYKTYDMLPASSLFKQTGRTLEQEFKAALKEAAKQHKPLVVESSGINLRLNQLLQEYDHLTILVSTPLEIINKRIAAQEKVEFDPVELNNSILKRLANGTIQYDTKYFTQLDEFYPVLKKDMLKKYKD